MMEQIVTNLINRLLLYELITEKDKYLYHYSLQILMEKAISSIVIFFLAFIWNIVLETLLFLVCFSTIRKHTGGYHSKNFSTCLLGSISIYIVYTKYIYLILAKNMHINLILLLFATFITLIIGAINHPNMDWNKKEYRDSKKISRIIVITETICIIGLFYLGMKKSYILYMSFGLMLSAILLVLGKITKQEVLE